jgi:predicted CoA-substrate-specific enzyme activase
MNYFLGLDVGNSTVKAVVLDENKNIIFKKCIQHFGQPVIVSKNLIEEISKEFLDVNMLLSGANSSLIAPPEYIKSEVPALQNGVCLLYPHAKSLIEIGSQNARYITNIAENKPPLFAINENCAGGTGSFFEDQMNRLGLLTEDYSDIVKDAVSIPRLSGRCSVFAKTDIIHRQQEGVPTADILLGLCYATIKNLKSTIIKNLPIEKPIVLGGGVVHNSGVVKAVKNIFELSENEFVFATDNEFLQAVGTAKMAWEEKDALNIEDCLNNLNVINSNIKENDVRRLQPLFLDKNIKLIDPLCVAISKPTACHLGIDVGSTSTNLVLINDKKEIVDAQYLRTNGKPEQVVKDGLKAIIHKFGDKIIIKSVGVTGSGRYLIGKMVGADSIKDEITAQAKAAILVNPNADTVFEIGGQDSKYIQIDGGKVKDFQMNKICAAGTGSFIEEQAKRLNIEITNYGKIALSAKKPVDLGERCTVFIESNINACLSKGVEVADILAGLCHSVIHNYLIKVVGNKKVGLNIVLQGGVCYNPAVVAAFKAVCGDNATVSPYFSVSGAFGVAVLSMEEIGEKESTFLGFDLSKTLLQTKNILKSEIAQNIEIYQNSKKLLLGDYTRTLNPDKKTIGVPYVLVVHKFFPMIRHYFETLGYNVLLSPETDENIIALSQKYAKAETCYPVKLIYGHMAWLAEKKVDYIFLPSIHTMKHETSKVYHNYGCVYMQSAPKFVFESMNLKEKGIILLNPVFSLDFGKEAMASEMVGVGVSLGKAKPICAAALVSGAMAVRKHTAAVEKQGKELLKTIKPTDKVLVLVTRTYGIDDPVLNMNIPYELLSRGYKVITISHLPAHNLDISDEYENLYWPFGQHIVSGAKLIASHPNLYAVYLTNHGCAPDSMISHLFQKEMGNKPYLNIEVDEHYSKVGVITRIEAFLNSLKSQPIVSAQKKDFYFNNWKKENIQITNEAKQAAKTFIPNLYPYSQLIAKELISYGHNVEVLPETSKESLALGREITTTKEYLSFIALAGDVLAKEKELTENSQVIIPQTEGSEAGGIFPRVIYNYLSKDSKLSLVAKTVETLPFKNSNFNSFFLAILAGDVVLSAKAKDRKNVLNNFLNSELTLDLILNNASQIDNEDCKRVLLVGDPYILYNATLYDGVFDEVENNKLKIMKMPLSEYLLYMWQKRAETKEETEIVDALIQKAISVHKALHVSSTFCDDFYKLKEVAEAKIGSYTGGNGAYRFAKHKLSKVDAIIDVAPMYENTQTILNLLNNSTEVPLISLNFEGTNDISSKEKLKSFLYYV